MGKRQASRVRVQFGLSIFPYHGEQKPNGRKPQLGYPSFKQGERARHCITRREFNVIGERPLMSFSPSAGGINDKTCPLLAEVGFSLAADYRRVQTCLNCSYHECVHVDRDKVLERRKLYSKLDNQGGNDDKN